MALNLLSYVKEQVVSIPRKEMHWEESTKLAFYAFDIQNNQQISDLYTI